MMVTLSFETEQPASVVNEYLAAFLKTARCDDFDMANVVLSYIDGRKTFVYRMPYTEDRDTREEWTL